LIDPSFCQVPVSTSREQYVEFRRSLARTPPLVRRSVRARGLDFAVWTSPDVPGATPLVIVNGGMVFGHELLWPALSPLASSRQLVLYDQRGRGESAAPPGALASRIEHDAGDVPALREAMGIERWDVLGHSWGGGIALLAAGKDAGGTRRLVLVDAVGVTSGWIAGMHDRALRRLDPPRRSALEPIDPLSLRHPDPGLHSTYSRAFHPAWFADPDFADGITPPRAISLTGAAIAARLRREGYDWTDAARAVAIPTLVVHGELDPLPADEARRIAQLIPGARLVLIPNCGHMPFWESPETFFALVDAFLPSD
jgi:proline iminopeptidase